MPLEQRVIGRLRNLEPIPSERPDREGCQHHWVIEAANGSTAAGRCLRCGEIRDFPTSWLDIAPGVRAERRFRRMIPKEEA